MTATNQTGSAGAPQNFGAFLSTLLIPFAKRFIAGTTLAEALSVVSKLKSDGFSTTLDHLGEDVANALEAKASADQYVVMLKALKERGCDRNVSLKLTQIGLCIDRALCAENLGRIVRCAEEMGGFVRVDMEGSDLTDLTLDTVLAVKKNRATPVGIVLQAMLKRTPTDAVAAIERDTTIRLCKGAYKEPAAIAHHNMRDIRRQYVALAKRFITSNLYHGMATHDKIIIEEIIAFARENRISPENFEFQMLYGVKPKLQKRIMAQGFKVRIYVPFGRSWLPYTWRRLRERKENVWFIVKNLFGG